uniref:Uncharacterized protein n=1 Tax=Podarcis muralis TaxID=64176 RepID=A0A670JQF4_PODMU
NGVSSRCSALSVSFPCKGARNLGNAKGDQALSPPNRKELTPYLPRTLLDSKIYFAPSVQPLQPLAKNLGFPFFPHATLSHAPIYILYVLFYNFEYSFKQR